MTPNVPVEALPRIVQSLATELAVSPRQVDAAVALLDEGATVPFIARYRKEATGNLDDTQLRTLEERLLYLRELEERRAVVLCEEAVRPGSRVHVMCKSHVLRGVVAACRSERVLGHFLEIRLAPASRWSARCWRWNMA